MIAQLEGLVALIKDEAARNPGFAEKLNALFQPVEPIAAARPKVPAKRKDIDVPDVHVEFDARGDEGFREWLHAQPADTLKAIIRHEGFDPARRAAKWKDERKLVTFIADALRARMSRGSAFIGRTHDRDDSPAES
ncbi:hypothetical protein NK8_61160 (plasmid) [Caballeronia sp. NK8]|uniref:hypothetical protein n=1 Tax=Caballeronia sp. NK8 TaxID=140098 RepID=UPI001BB49F74|nr:hypothetical protein [Caballeronia sp. NK8]BCQ27927.1 hypothetical protein NK8_61160 [Caballeronia sp. NK8]